MKHAPLTLAALLALIGLELLVGAFTHRTEAQLERAARASTGGAPADVLRERMAAMHVLANRDAPRVYGAETVRELLASEEPVLREFAMTYLFSRADGAQVQRDRYDAQPEDLRLGFYFRHQKLPMHRDKVSRYFAEDPDAAPGSPAPPAPAPDGSDDPGRTSTP